MAKKGKRGYVSDDTFAELMESAEQALVYERGKSSGCRFTRVTSAPQKVTSRNKQMLPKNIRRIYKGHRDLEDK